VERSTYNFLAKEIIPVQGVKAYERKRGVAAHILNLHTRRRKSPAPLYPGKEPSVPIE
jgi:hypothetical protein